MKEICQIEQQRCPNIELLRVAAMILIVIGHYCWHGIKANPSYATFPVDTIPNILNYCAMEYLWIVACIGVDCFVLITGYFLADKLVFRWKAILKIWLQTVFYCILSICVFSVVTKSFSIKDLVSAVMPFRSQAYWFVTKYFGLMLIAPFLSMLLRQLTKRQYHILLCVGFIISFQPLYGTRLVGTMSMWWFVYLYVVAAYIKLHSLPDWLVRSSGKIFFAISFLFFVAVTVYNKYLHGSSGTGWHLVSSANDGPIFFLALSAFIFFTKIDISTNKLLLAIAKLAPYAFGVYLIHENNFVKELGLWETVIPKTIKLPMPVHCVLSAVSIFAVCSFVDFLRSCFFGFIKVDYVIEKITKKLPKTLNPVE